jgi:hypothetical protein
MTEKGPLKLNSFYVDIGASGLTKKSIAMRYYAKATVMELEKLVQEKLLLPEEFTDEGMHEYFLSVDVPSLEGVERGFPVSTSGLIFQDEFSKFIREARNKRYMSGQLEFLSELWDGYVKSRFTRTSKYQASVEVCVNLVAASTPAVLPLLQPEFFRLGLGNRILFIYSGSGFVDRLDSERYFLPDLEDERVKHIKYFADQLHGYNEICKGKLCLLPAPEAAKWLAEYEFQKKMEAQNLYNQDVLSLVYSYIDRLPVFAFKISALHAIDRERDSKSDLIEVNLSDAKWATENVDDHFKQFKDLLELWELLERAERTKIRRRDPDEIKSLVAVTVTQGISENDLRLKAYSKGFSPERFRECLHMITQSGEVVSGTLDTGKPGPKPTVFYLKAFEPKNPAWLKKKKDQDEHTQN